MESMNIVQSNMEKIESIFPNCIKEVRNDDGIVKKSIDFDVLKQNLSDDLLDSDERYDFTWVGKKESIKLANTPTRKTLRPIKDSSVEWEKTENLYIEGDNLEVLKLLQESYFSSIKVIYIDPPYNTGSDLIYNDSSAVKTWTISGIC